MLTQLCALALFAAGSDNSAPTSPPDPLDSSSSSSSSSPQAASSARDVRWFGFGHDLAEHGLDLFAVDVKDIELQPTATVVGGVGFDHIEHGTSATDQRQDRWTTIALARTGLFANLGRYLQIESEIEFNAGPDGTSVWEGQAAIQVHNQLIHLRLPQLIYDDALVIEVGRVTDPTSINYFASTTADQLLTDDVARTPLLMAGFNLGNGIQARYTLFDALTLGATLNAGNPTSNTASLQIGGTFPPFARFYEVPYASVAKDASGFPDNSFHIVLFAPSISVDTHYVKAHVSTQLIHADTNMNSTKDQPLEGFNVRGGAEVTVLEDVLWKGNKLSVFGNVSRIENDVVKKDDLSSIQNFRYESYSASGGVDLALFGKSGVGAEVAVVREREPGSAPVMWEFANVGATWWVNDVFALSARGAYEQQCADVACNVDGVREVFVTGRVVLGPVESK